MIDIIERALKNKGYSITTYAEEIGEDNTNILRKLKRFFVKVKQVNKWLKPLDIKVALIKEKKEF